jgi:hypothetical protein
MSSKVLEELLKAGLTQERAQECWKELQKEIDLHDIAAVNRELSTVEQQNSPQTEREERHEERREKSRDEFAQRIVSLALRAKSDPVLQERLTHMPIIGKAVAFVRQAIEQQSAAASQQSSNWPPNPLNTRNFTPFKR